MESACRITGRSSWSDADKHAITSICRLVDGLPLAIEHSASWLNTLSCEDIAGELEKSFDLLTTTLQDVPFEHRSMQAILDASWEMLSAEEQIAVYKLSGLCGSFGRAEAAEAAGVSLNVLSALIEKSALNLVLQGIIICPACSGVTCARSIYSAMPTLSSPLPLDWSKRVRLPLSMPYAKFEVMWVAE